MCYMYQHFKTCVHSVCCGTVTVVTESKENPELLIVFQLSCYIYCLCRDQQPSVTHRKPWTVNEQELFEQGLVSFCSKHMIVILVMI